MTINYVVPICDRMKLKSNEFVGLTLKEEKAIIESLVKALSLSNSLSEPNQHLIDSCIQIMLRNQELKISTFNRLVKLLPVLGIELVNLHRDKNKDFLWGAWYNIPLKNKETANKKLTIRKRKRNEVFENAWYETFGETFGWEEIIDKDAAKKRLKSKLGSNQIDELDEERDPGNAVILPFTKRND